MMNSIDATTMLPRTVEAADLQGREINQNQHALDQNAVQFQKDVEQMAQRPVEAQKTETQEYEMDDGGGNGKGASSNRRKKEKKKKEAPIAPRSDSSFDIMI